MQDNKLLLADLAEGIKLDLNNAAGSMLAAGDKLRGARKLLPSDNAYGKWCKDNFSKSSRRYLGKLRQVAENAELRKLIDQGLHSFNAVVELLAAPERVIKEVTDADKPTTVKEVREKVKAAKEEDSGGPTSADLKPTPLKEALAKELAEDNAARVRNAIDGDYELEPPQPTLEDAWHEYLWSPVAERILHFIEQDRPMDHGWAFFVYGIASTFEDDETPSREETEMRYKFYLNTCHSDKETGSEEIMAALNEAKMVIDNYYVAVANDMFK